MLPNNLRIDPARVRAGFLREGKREREYKKDKKKYNNASDYGDYG